MTEIVEPIQGDVAHCRIGSCQRNRNCMYTPCRARTALASDAATPNKDLDHG